jgi:hypothetical protein
MDYLCVWACRCTAAIHGGPPLGCLALSPSVAATRTPTLPGTATDAGDHPAHPHPRGRG